MAAGGAEYSSGQRTVVVLNPRVVSPGFLFFAKLSFKISAPLTNLRA
jgi:hypothetical protein